ncbi:MAG TPA: RidA family protein [Gemmatimonadales bacterium]|jgi:enamine deaminase RidA (YjgF/YER057c/UK114 family)
MNAFTPLAGRASLLLVLLAFPILIAHAQERRPRFINPPGLTKPSGYTHVVVTSDGRTAHIAGQVALDSAVRVVGAGDFKAQAEKVFANLRMALASVDASFEDVLKTTTYITSLENLPALREARGRYFDPARPPANTLVVAMLARPEFLLEIEAVAVRGGASRFSGQSADPYRRPGGSRPG